MGTRLGLTRAIVVMAVLVVASTAWTAVRAPVASATPASTSTSFVSPPFALADRSGGTHADVNDVTGYKDRFTWNNKTVGGLGVSMHEHMVRLAKCDREQKCHTRWTTFKPPTKAGGVGTQVTPNWAGQEFIEDAVDEIGLRNRCKVDGPEPEKIARNAGCTKSGPWGELHPLSPEQPPSTVQGVPTMVAVRVWRECAMDDAGRYIGGGAGEAFNGAYTDARVGAGGRQCSVDPIYERMIPRNDHGSYDPEDYFYSLAGEMKGNKAFGAYAATGVKRRAGVLYGDCLANPNRSQREKCYKPGFSDGSSPANFQDACVTGIGKAVHWTKAELLGEVQWRTQNASSGWPAAKRQKGTLGDESVGRLYEWALGDKRSMASLREASKHPRNKDYRGLTANLACDDLSEWISVQWTIPGQKQSGRYGYLGGDGTPGGGGSGMFALQGNLIPGRMYLVQVAVLDRAENILQQSYKVMTSAPQPGCVGWTDGKIYKRGDDRCDRPPSDSCLRYGGDPDNPEDWLRYPPNANAFERAVFYTNNCWGRDSVRGDSCTDAKGTQHPYPAGATPFDKVVFKNKHCNTSITVTPKYSCLDRNGDAHDITADPDGLRDEKCPPPPPLQCIDARGVVHEVPPDQTGKLNELCPVAVPGKVQATSAPASGSAAMQAPMTARAGVPMTTRVTAGAQPATVPGDDDGGDPDLSNSMWFPRSSAFALFSRQAAKGNGGSSYESSYDINVTGGGDPFQRHSDGYPGLLGDPVDGPTWAARVPLIPDNNSTQVLQSRVTVEARDATLRPRDPDKLEDQLASHNVQYSTVLGESRHPDAWRADEDADYQWIWQRLTMDTCNDGVSSRYPHFNAAGNGCRAGADLGSGWNVRDAYTFPATDSGVPVEMTSLFAQRETGRARVQLDSSLVAHNKIVAIELWAADRYSKRSSGSKPDYVIPPGSIPAAHGEIHACKPTITRTITVNVFDRYEIVQVWRYVYEYMLTLWRIEPDGTEVWGWNWRWDWVLKNEEQPVYRQEQREIEVENPDCPNPNAQAWDVDPVTGNPQGPVTKLPAGTWVARYVANGPIAAGTSWGLRAQTMIDPGEQWVAKYNLSTNREFEQVFRGRAVG